MAFIVIAIIVWIILKRLLKESAVDIVLLVIWGVLVASYVQMLLLNGKMSLLTGDRAVYNSFTIGTNLLIWAVVMLSPLCLWIVFKLGIQF